MTQKPEETIARLLELDAKRTQGIARTLHETNVQISGRYFASTGGYSSNITGDNWSEDNANNAAFIAQVANSIPAIRQLLATMAVMGEALELLIDYAPNNCGQEALTAYAPYKALAEKVGA